MKIKINGKERIIKASSPTIAELLESEKVETPQYVSVQLNGEFVKRENFNTTHVKEADEIDFLYFMGGGAL